MVKSWICVALAFALLALSSCSSPQSAASDKAPSGTWSGDYGMDAGRRDPIGVELRWEDVNLRGTVKAGPRSFPITKASYKADSGDITFEFDAEGNRGQKVHYTVDGKVSGNNMTGTWSHDDQRGDFKVTKE